MPDYIPVVNHPIVPKAPKSRHAGGHSGGHVRVSNPKPAAGSSHVRARSSTPHAPRAHAGSGHRSSGHASARAHGEASAERKAGLSIRSSAGAYAHVEAAAEKAAGLDITGIVGAGPDPNQNTDGTMGVYTGPSYYAIEQQANQDMQRQNVLQALASGATVSDAQQKQFHIGKYATRTLNTSVASGTRLPAAPAHIGSSRSAAAQSHTRTHTGTTHVKSPKAPASPKAKHAAAPLTLTDASIQGHDSHVSHPTHLTPVLPVTNRRSH